MTATLTPPGWQRDPATLSPLEQFVASFPAEQREEAISRFYDAHTGREREQLRYAWYRLHARPDQRMPTDDNWDTWIVRAGRGGGKTRSGAEAVRRRVEQGKARSITLIGPTAADARDVMIEGPESGLLAVHPPETRPDYKPSTRTITWANGAIGHVRTAEEPDSTLGLNSDLIWGDEVASWKSGRAAWDNAMLGNRLGDPKAIITTTPRPLAWLRELEQLQGTRVTHFTTYDNIAHLADAFIRLIVERFEGTRLGRQELYALYLDDTEGALWTLATIEQHRITRFDRDKPVDSLIEHLSQGVVDLGRIAALRNDRRPWRTLVAVDPPGETAECGIVAGCAPKGGIAGRDHAVVLADESIAGRPEEWGAQVVKTFRTWKAEAVYVEANQGGDMCRATIHAVDPTVPVHKIRAKPGESKKVRAEPVSALYERGWVHHYGNLAKLEDQQTTWVAGESKSPDRLDAAVHLLRALLKQTELVPARIASPARSGRRIR